MPVWPESRLSVRWLGLSGPRLVSGITEARTVKESWYLELCLYLVSGKASNTRQQLGQLCIHVQDPYIFFKGALHKDLLYKNLEDI